MTIDERLDRLTGIVESLAASVVSHDDQIESLFKVAEKHQAEMAELRRSIAETDRLWQAYLKRLPPQ
jgi:peptidoglycan hydrolase CwlO-like protein